MKYASWFIYIYFFGLLPLDICIRKSKKDYNKYLKRKREKEKEERLYYCNKYHYKYSIDDGIDDKVKRKQIKINKQK